MSFLAQELFFMSTNSGWQTAPTGNAAADAAEAHRLAAWERYYAQQAQQAQQAGALNQQQQHQNQYKHQQHSPQVSAAEAEAHRRAAWDQYYAAQAEAQKAHGRQAQGWMAQGAQAQAAAVAAHRQQKPAAPVSLPLLPAIIPRKTPCASLGSSLAVQHSLTTAFECSHMRQRRSSTLDHKPRRSRNRRRSNQRSQRRRLNSSRLPHSARRVRVTCLRVFH